MTALGLLIATHSHPAISRGGAELAAWRLFEGMRVRPDVTARFLGCGREPGGGRTGGSITQPFGEDEFLYATGGFDWFKFANHDPRFPRDFAAMLATLRPDVLHFHHYVNFGVEAFLIARRTLPDCKIVLTLHEFQAICNHYGQMVTKQNRNLCYAATPRDCTRCFPEFSRADLFLRNAYIRRFFELVDAFVSPSHFLAERYIAWGLPEAKFRVIENVVAEPAPTVASTAGAPPGAVFRVGFFGQISLLKGINVLLDAARILEDEGEAGVSFEVHGDYTNQPQEFQADFLARLEKVGRNVHVHGPYANERVDTLMRSVDVVAIPSIWWENSPVVIQECLRNRRPMVCSNIGGMAEKVRPGLDGWHVNVGSASELAALLRDLAADPGKCEAVRATMRASESPAVSIDAHLALYDSLLGLPAQAARTPATKRPTPRVSSSA